MIPLGNQDQDVNMQTIDVLYSRFLNQSNFINWYSETNNPDLGGNEDSNYRQFLFDQEDQTLEKIQKGFYKNYSVEISVNLVSVNALLQAPSIYEFDRAKQASSGPVDLEAAFENQNMEFDTAEMCIPAFQKLRDLVLSLF